MDKFLSAVVDDAIPSFNPVIVNGLAVKEMKGVEPFVDQIFRTAAVSFPEGLKYLGFVRCTPEEEVRQILERASRSKRVSKIRTTLELSHNDTYMVRIRFSFQNEPLEDQFLYLPYVRDGGLITLRDSTYMISPTLADNTLSVGQNSIFMQMSCGKLTFERSTHHFLKNHERETVSVVSSLIHNHRDKKGDEPRMKVGATSILVNYLFCKHGLHKTFQLYAGADVIVGTVPGIASATPAMDPSMQEANAVPVPEITPEAYPPDKWFICRSTGMIPRGYKLRFYRQSNIALAIRKDQYTPLVANLVGGFFYLVDFYPEQVFPQFVDYPRLWMALLGYVIFGQGGSDGRLLEDIGDHMNSLDKYLNGEIQQALANDGITVEDIYQFFVHIIETTSQRIAERSANLSSMYDKRLMVLRFALSDISMAVNSLMFKLQKAAKKNLNRFEITSLMRKMLKHDLIVKMNQLHAEVSSVSTPGDNKFYKITSVLVPQSSSSGRRKGASKAKSNTSDPSKHLHVSIAEVGSYTNLPKSDPIGHSRISPYVRIREDGTILRNPDLVALLDKTQLLIQR